MLRLSHKLKANYNMKKELIRDTKELYYILNGVKIIGRNPLMLGDCSGLTGNCTDLRGDCSGLQGYCSGLQGNVTGVIGICSGLRGNFDLCEINSDDRIKGIQIIELIKNN